ncbi:MAG: sulfatase-like hydrolase/transferase [Proteobacteria bacterium]|nr:sulfatase-like hydrolase/transferase [Pseudomonadota bacterium]
MRNGARPNILFIMADQLRADYLGCAGHPVLQTPAIDELAARGTRFSHAFVQAPVCGGSRMSTYTGRYGFSHGALGNGYALRIDEPTMGQVLRDQGYRVALVGKTHMVHDAATFTRLGLDPDADPGLGVRECGFEPFERDDGLYPDHMADPDLAYNRFLWQQGYEAEHPWHDIANAALGPDGAILSGWHMRNAHLPARVAPEHSETAWMTDRAMAFIDEAGQGPWCLHLSYIKPHWPYIAPAPWHGLYRDAPLAPANRSEGERADPHPVFAAFMEHAESLAFSRGEVRANVIPAYMGLIAKIDHHIGRLMAHLRQRGLADDTVVVFTSDHGDYLGDHWLGEKDLFHEAVVRVPLIVADPRPGADAGRGRVVDDLAEAVDLAATFLEMAGGEAQPHRLKGRSLVPLLAGQRPDDWREAAFSDGCFAKKPARVALGLDPSQACAFMVRTARWKYVHFQAAPPMLFDLQEDPCELRDLSRDGGCETVRREMRDRLLDHLVARRLRIATSDEEIARQTAPAVPGRWPIGVW